MCLAASTGLDQTETLTRLQECHHPPNVPLRALEGDLGCGVKLIAEGAEEQATGGLEEFVAGANDLVRFW